MSLFSRNGTTLIKVVLQNCPHFSLSETLGVEFPFLRPPEQRRSTEADGDQREGVRAEQRRGHARAFNKHSIFLLELVERPFGWMDEIRVPSGSQPSWVYNLLYQKEGDTEADMGVLTLRAL